MSKKRLNVPLDPSAFLAGLSKKSRVSQDVVNRDLLKTLKVAKKGRR